MSVDIHLINLFRDDTTVKPPSFINWIKQVRCTESPSIKDAESPSNDNSVLAEHFVTLCGQGKNRRLSTLIQLVPDIKSQLPLAFRNAVVNCKPKTIAFLESYALIHNIPLSDVNMDDILQEFAEHDMLVNMQWLWSLYHVNITYNGLLCSFATACSINSQSVMSFIIDCMNEKGYRLKLDSNDHMIVTKCCKHGQYKVLEWLISFAVHTKQIIDFVGKNNQPFIECVAQDNLEFAKQLLQLSKKYGRTIDLNTKDVIVGICKMGSFAKIQWLLETSKHTETPINVVEHGELMMQTLIGNHYLEVAEVLLMYSIKIEESINLNSHNDIIFRTLCSKSDVKTIEWFVALCDNNYYEINMSAENNDAFRAALTTGNPEIYEYVLQLCDERDYPVDFAENGDSFFVECCKTGHVDQAKYIYEYCKKIGHPVNIHYKDSLAFTSACCNRHEHVVKWLANMYVGYDYRVDNNGSIHYNIMPIIEYATINVEDNYEGAARALGIRIMKDALTFEDFECPICSSQEIINIVKLSCGHKYCLECLLNLYNKNNTNACQYCKKQYSWKQCMSYNRFLIT